MGGGLMQLVAYGAQDVYLSGNPQITFFKVVYRRHTNFAVEPIEQTWNGSATFGRQVTCNINRNGDLITNMYVVVNLPAVTTSNVPWGYVNRLGHALVSECKVEIGGSKIDEQWGDWLNIWYELSHKVGQERGYAKMIGDTPELKSMSLTKPETILYVPLQFWFNRNNGLALPLIALQYHDVRVTVYFREASGCVNYVGSTLPSNVTAELMSDSHLLIDYVYLDSEERKRFAQASHEYLIEQLQFTGAEHFNSNTNKFRLNFNHPSKYLIWAAHLEKYVNPASSNQYLAYATDASGWMKARDEFAVIIAAANAEVYATAPDNILASANTVNYVTVTNNVLTKVLIKNAGAKNSTYTVLKKQDTTKNVLSKLSAKVLVQFILVDTDTLATSRDELLKRAVVINNDLTMEDLSNTVADLQVKLTNGDLLSDGAVALLKACALTVRDYTNYGTLINGSNNTCTSGKIQLNGHDRFTSRDGNYFNYVQPLQHFSNTPADGINVYSFALKAEDHQPTGTCNFSRIDNATLNLSGDAAVGNDNTTNLNIYTVNYNVLRVMSGMAGTAYSN
jgi:hypothetical protein